MPEELLELLEMPTTPKELWAEMVRARDEIDNYGAVAYPTKSRIESLYLNFKLNTGMHNRDFIAVWPCAMI